MSDIHVNHPIYGHMVLCRGQYINPHGRESWSCNNEERIAKAQIEVDAANERLGVVLKEWGVPDPGTGAKVEIPATLPGIDGPSRMWISMGVPVAPEFDRLPAKPNRWMKKMVSEFGLRKDPSIIIIGVDGRIATARKHVTSKTHVSLVFSDWDETWAALIIAGVVTASVGIRAILPEGQRPIGKGWLQCVPIIREGKVESRRWVFWGPTSGVWTPIAGNWSEQ